MNNFKPSNFFDLSNFKYADIFEGEDLVWNVVKKIPLYLAQAFEGGKVKGNFRSDVYVEEGADVDPTAKILGPAIICKGARIGFNALIRENVIIGEASQVRFTEVKNSIILNYVLANHMSYIGDSIVGSNTNIGSGAKLANLRFDKENVVIKVSDTEKIDSKLKKLGAIIGDGSNIGVNSVLNPGTILGKNSNVYPLTLAKGVYPNNSVIK